jgi:lactoylglutathione lyase
MLRRAQETMYYVSDLDAAIEFYTQKLGFTLMHREDWGFAFLDADDRHGRIGLISLDLFRQHHPEDPEYPRPRLVFNVASLDEEIAELHRKGVRVSQVYVSTGSTRSATFYDADNNPFFMWETGTGRLFEQE